MAAKRFVFAKPEQLKEISKLCIGERMKIESTATLWSVIIRQKKKFPWCGRIGASFYTEDGENKACVFRFSMNDEMRVLGFLKYQDALKWCEENLAPAA